MVKTKDIPELYPLAAPKLEAVAGSRKQEAGIQVKQRKKYTINSNHHQPAFDNVLNREFEATAPDQVYAGDITYLWTQEGWL